MVKKAISNKIEKQIKEYVEALKKDNLPLSRVILFGSYAKGNSHKWSDIDLCVVSSKFKDPLKAMQYLWLKRKSDSFPAIEPVGFGPEDFEDEDSLIHEIKRTGIEIKV